MEEMKKSWEQRLAEAEASNKVSRYRMILMLLKTVVLFIAVIAITETMV